MHPLRDLLRIPALLLLLSATAAPQEQPLEAVLEGDQLRISVAGELFTTYRFATDQKYPYFYPVNGPLSGASVTTESSEPYPHHHSLFFACDRVNGANYWQEENARGQIVSEGPQLLEAAGSRVVFTDTCRWRVPGEPPVMTDTRRVTVSAPDALRRFIDFEITLDPQVKIGIEKTNHSLFSARVVPELSVKAGGTLVNAEGESAEQGTFGLPSAWCDYSGTRDGKTEGIALFQHPRNRWYPAPWFTRDYGFFSPTPLYWIEGDRLELKPGERLTLRYRVVVHAGDAAGMETLFRDYATPVRLMTLDPGHFHAALVQKTMYGPVDPLVHVYAPEGPDLVDHERRIDGFNTRADAPTAWHLKIYTGGNYLDRMLAERPGNVVVLSGRNRPKAKYIKACVDAGLNVLADKPMCVDPEGYALLRQAFDVAEEKSVLLCDIMTERFEITTLLQKELAASPQLFGGWAASTPDDPAVVKESVHHFFKHVAGKPLKRPAWFFDTSQQGEGIVDVTTHLIDLVLWACRPGESVDFERDIRMVRARRWPTLLSLQQFEAVTHLDAFPDDLALDLDPSGAYPCFANGEIVFALGDIHARIDVSWNYQAPAGAGDTHYSIFRGNRAEIIIRQGAEEDYKPTLYVRPAPGVDRAVLEVPLDAAIAALQPLYPGLGLEPNEDGWCVLIPDAYRVGHEAHFRQVTENYLHALEAGQLPAWEVPNMITKYRITTEALKLAKE